MILDRKGVKTAPKSPLKKSKIALATGGINSPCQNTPAPTHAPKIPEISTPKNADFTSDKARGSKAWLLYTNLPTITPDFNAPNLSKNLTASEINYQELLSSLNDYLDYEDTTLDQLLGKGLFYSLCDLMRATSPSQTRHKSCRTFRIRATEKGRGGKLKEKGVTITYDYATKQVGVTNLARCFDPLCAYCNNHDWNANLVTARQVQRTHLKSGGNCLLGTLTAHHTHRTRLDKFQPLMQSAYENFVKQSKPILAKYGLVGRLKRNEYGYSFKNGHHFHIHYALAVGAVSEETVLMLGSELHTLWLACLELVGLKGGEQASDLRETPFAFEYVAKKHKSDFSPSDLNEIINKVNDNKALTLFELGFLAMIGDFDKDKFAQIQAEVIDCYANLAHLQYSRGFKDKLGLVDYIKPKKPRKPRKPKPATIPLSMVASEPQRHATPLQLDLFGEVIQPPKPTRHYTKKAPSTATQLHLVKDGLIRAGDSTKPKKQKVNLFTLHWYQWQELDHAGEIPLFMGMIKKAVESGYFKGVTPPYH